MLHSVYPIEMFVYGPFEKIRPPMCSSQPEKAAYKKFEVEVKVILEPAEPYKLYFWRHLKKKIQTPVCSRHREVVAHSKKSKVKVIGQGHFKDKYSE